MRFATFVQNFIVNYTIEDYCDFLKRFTEKVAGEEDQEEWLINEYPLLTLNLCINTNVKKEKQKKKVKDNKEEKDK